jgi:hypothetical protein
MKAYRIRHKNGLYYAGKYGTYNEFGKIYDRKRLKLAWKNMFDDASKEHEIEIVELRVIDILDNLLNGKL